MNLSKLNDARFFDTKRLKDLGDGIFAFAMTFLIISIDIPRVPIELLPVSLLAMVPDILTYILSFFLLAIFWMTNHINMKDIKSADSRLVWINILLFLMIVFVPLTSDIYAFYEGSVAAMLAFNVNILLIGLVFLLQWHHLAANSLHHEQFTKEEVNDRYKICQVLIAAALMAIILGWFYPAWAPLVYLVTFAYRTYLRIKWLKQTNGTRN